MAPKKTPKKLDFGPVISTSSHLAPSSMDLGASLGLLRFFEYVSELVGSVRGEITRKWPLDAPSRPASGSTRRTSPTFLDVIQSVCILCVPSMSFLEDL